MRRHNLALDFGGTYIKAAIMKDGVAVARGRIETRSDKSDLDRVAELAFALCADNDIPVSSLGGLGLSVPGIINTDTKTPLSINGKHAHLVGVDLDAWARKTFSLPAIVDNDARLALAGEAGYGVAKGRRNAVMMILGTGIGTAAMMDGALLRGAHYQAGVLGGHITIESNGYVCTCGNRGCAEAEAGSWNMPTIARDHPGFAHSALSRASVIDFKAITDAHRAGDEVASAVLARLVQCWAICVVNLIHAYDPEIIVLSGGLMRSHDLIVEPLRAYIADHAWASTIPEIAIAADGEISALLGLDYLINNNENKEHRS